MTTLTIDDAETGVPETYSDAQIDLDLVEELIRRLDGARHSMVTLAAGDRARMAVGGHAQAGLVVYEARAETQTVDAYHVLSPNDFVSMAAGLTKSLVDVDRALKAAKVFAASGRLAPNLVWQRF